jgi:PKD repeat protein
MWDQLVLSSAKYRSSAPGAVRADSTIVSTSLGSSTRVTALHTYSTAGVFPLELTVTDEDGPTATAITTVTVK